MADHVLKSEAGVEEFVGKVAERIRTEVKGEKFQPVAFVMSAQFPLHPAAIHMSPWLALDHDKAVNVLRAAVTKYDAFGVLVIVEATRFVAGVEEPVILFQLDHQYIGGQAWHAKRDGEQVCELERLNSVRGGSFCNIIPAESKAN